MTNLSQYQEERDTAGREFALHPPGSHIARLADAFILPTRAGKPDKDGKTKPYTPVQCVFVTRKKDPEGNAIWLWYQLGSGVYISKRGKSKMFLLYEALLGQTLGQQEAVNMDLETLVGRYARVAVAHVPRGDDSTKMTAQVTNVSALSEDDDSHAEIGLSGYSRPAKYREFKPLWAEEDGRSDYANE